MAKKYRLSFFFFCVVGSALSFALRAEAKVDLDRVTPVAAMEQIPVLDFFRPRILQDPTVNPAGTHIAAVVAAGEDHTSLMVYDLNTQKMESLGTRGDSDVDMVQWLNDRYLSYRISVKKFSGFIMGAAKVGSLQNTYPILQNFNGGMVAVPPGDRLHPLIRIGRGSEVTGQYGAVVSVNASIDTGKFMDLSGNGALLDAKVLDDASEDNVRHIMTRFPVLPTPDGFDLNYLADKEGHLEFGITSTHGRHTLHHLNGEKWETCPQDLDEINVIGCGDNPGEIVVLGPRQENQPRALEVMEGATGKVVEVLIQDKTYDCDGWLYRDPVSRNIVGVVYDRGGPHVTWFSEAYRNLQKLVDGLFPGQVVRIIGNDEAGKMVLLSVYSDRQPAIYSWVDLEKHTAGLIKNSAPWIDPKRMQPMNVMKFKTRDGRQLDAIVTLPAGATKQNPPPLVVVANNWTGQRSSWGFDAETQFLASRGYAVMRPNCRGSAGYTGKFPTDDEWAYAKMYEDVIDATKTLTASGLVDRDRVGIIGTSFGGFLALSGVAYEPGLYRCAASISGTFDWGKLLEEQKYSQYSNSNYARMLLKLGDPKKETAKFDALAPLRHADQIRVPVFIAEGEYDSSLEIAQSKELVSIVGRNHIPTEWVSFVNEASGVRHLEHKIELYTRLEAFLAKNLSPAKSAGAATGSP
jgi:dienelactone hydrolase